MKAVQVRIISVLNACRNHGLTRMAPTTSTSILVGPPRFKPHSPPPPPPPPQSQVPFLPRPFFTPSPYGNYCLDLFIHVVPEEDSGTLASHERLNQMLHLAWFKNPLTTVKLICNLLDRRGYGGKDDRDSFYKAAFWLHRHHPKTLACNVASIASSFGSFDDLTEILYRLLHGQDVRRRNQYESIDGFRVRRKGSNSKVLSCRRLTPREVRVMKALERSKLQEEKARAVRRDKAMAMANTAIERYQNDPDYRFLHDRISDVFAECFKSDIQNLNKEKDANYDRDQDCLELSLAADYCPKIGSSMDCATLLCESIAKKVFPRELYPEYQGIEEAHYAYRVRDRLRKEVLVPLRKALDVADYHAGANKWGYNPDFKREPCAIKKYLEDVKAGGESKIRVDALFPHEIMRYANHPDVGESAEIQWKAMVEDMRMNKGMNVLNKCIAVCDVSPAMTGRPRDVSTALTLMMSELSEEPWKGKVITFSESPQLISIQGGDLKSNREFLRNMGWGYHTTFSKVFDLILEAAVNEKLKPEHMVKKVFVLTSCSFLERGFDDNSCWESEYEAVRSKFKKEGYGDVVPQLVFWNLNLEDLYKEVRSEGECQKQEGISMLSFVNDNLIKSLLENDGNIGLEHVMEAVISGQGYQSLVVVD
ncbi:PREDICTED: LOW QUALITY PROTEIN [Prunus dulcis]|uniref:PREDICTED: LOW QUALITY PROTEIN n=2 Tax=Prunus dulcis TaxID=3755 RepID=A0A5E4F0X7_PRUDU|nr:PREDICTED: LOW QUALITY PROTEIN [Prunus dulcis]